MIINEKQTNTNTYSDRGREKERKMNEKKNSEKQSVCACALRAQVHIRKNSVVRTVGDIFTSFYTRIMITVIQILCGDACDRMCIW